MAGWLVIFDQRSGQPDIAERTTTDSAITPAGRIVTVVRAQGRCAPREGRRPPLHRASLFSGGRALDHSSAQIAAVVEPGRS